MSTPLLNTQSPLSREEFLAQQEQQRALLLRLDDKHEAVRRQAIEESLSLPAHEITGMLNSATRPELRVLPLGYVIAISSGPVVMSLMAWFVAALRCLKGKSILPSIGLILFGCFFLTASGILLTQAMREKRTRFSLRIWNSLTAILLCADDPGLLAESTRLLHLWEYKGAGNAYLGSGSYRFFPPRMKEALYAAAARWLEIVDAEAVRDMGIRHPALLLFLHPARVRVFPHASLRVLTFLERFGTGSSLPAVVNLANIASLAISNPDVHAAAQSCLMALHQRVHVTTLPNTLLRAAAVPIIPQETLLRPVTPATAVPPSEQLLRSSSVEATCQR